MQVDTVEHQLPHHVKQMDPGMLPLRDVTEVNLFKGLEYQFSLKIIFGALSVTIINISV